MARTAGFKEQGLEATVNLDDYQRMAKRILSKALYEYLSSGTGDEQTLAENRHAFQLWYLRPRFMKPVHALTTRTTNWPGLQGTPVATRGARPNCNSALPQSITMPVFVSPAGVHGLCDPGNGELATARACARIGIPFGVSQHSTRSIEEIASAVNLPSKTNSRPSTPTTTHSPILWYQAYLLEDRERTLRLVQRAVKAGYQGIFLTVDSVRFGFREADARNGFNALPPPHRLVNYDAEIDEKDENSRNGQPSQRKLGGSLRKVYNAKKDKAWDQNIEKLFKIDVTWEDVRWLKENGCPNIPLIIKGIMTAEDAELAIQVGGADGIMVSNHGGRQLDGALSAIDALPEVVHAVNRRVPVFLDGGIRRGTDVLKALALGATAVGLGRPIFYALAVGGEDAVVNLLKMLKNELESAMALCGVSSVENIAPSLVTRHPSGSTMVRHVRSAL